MGKGSHQGEFMVLNIKLPSRSYDGNILKPWTRQFKAEPKATRDTPSVDKIIQGRSPGLQINARNQPSRLLSGIVGRTSCLQLRGQLRLVAVI